MLYPCLDSQINRELVTRRQDLPKPNPVLGISAPTRSNRRVEKNPRARSKESLATASVLASGSLAVLKLLVGWLSGSLGLLAEAAHSLLDLLSTLITYLVVRVAALPPDSNHPYGHERAEHLGALAGMTLLAGTGVLILYHAFDTILLHPGAPIITVWPFLVLVISVVVDFLRARTLRKAANSLESHALASDAEHFGNDMLGALAVIAALGLVGLHPYIPMPEWLVGRADALAALLVALLAFRSVWLLGSQAVRALMDDVPAELTDRLKKRVESVDGVVRGTVNVRTRFVGNRPFVEVKLGTQRGTSLESAHQLTETVEKELSAELGNAEAIVHVEPTATPNEPRAAIVRSIADRLCLRVHNLNIYLVGRETRIELDLELPDTLSLAEAHRHSESLESAISREVPGMVHTTIHLEPRNDEPRPAVHHLPSTQRVQEALGKLPEAENVKLQDVLVTDEGLVVTLEKKFPGSTPLFETHELMGSLERALRMSVPDVVRVHINPEIKSR
jgi:cation diffusion facilitator family transporter